ncbi:hypothetical protein ACIRBX_36260 [Kitasatospora sp. NPDC096147]|uniref:hypothetical protein n=1 Tax=Kitasatospora sp. NPDC096147 TaxID=3364093 RepID=UPI0037F83F40
MRPRTLATALAATALATLGTVGPAAAHGDTIAFGVTALVDGHLTLTATWQNDHDPVDEKIAGAVNATSTDGRAVGPWPLVAVAGPPGVYTTARQLPPGHWTVVVESGFPALGRGEAELDVTAVPGTAPSTPAPAPATPTAASPAPTTPTSPTGTPEPATTAATSAVAAPADAPDHGTLYAAIALAAAAAVAVAVGAPVLARRRRAKR